MVSELKITRVRGGNHHPLSVRTFILDHLGSNGQDYISRMHRAYKEELRRLAKERGRRYAYHKPCYHSFEMSVQNLAREGFIEFSGKEEVSDSPQFIGWEVKPLRRFYKLRES